MCYIIYIQIYLYKDLFLIILILFDLDYILVSYYFKANILTYWKYNTFV